MCRTPGTIRVAGRVAGALIRNRNPVSGRGRADGSDMSSLATLNPGGLSGSHPMASPWPSISPPWS